MCVYVLFPSSTSSTYIALQPLGIFDLSLTSSTCFDIHKICMVGKLSVSAFQNFFRIKDPLSIKEVIERSQNTVLLASTQVVYKALHSTVQGQLQLEHPCRHTHTESVSSRGSSRKSQSIRLELNTVESVAASCTYASVINASKDIQCIHCVQT